VGAEELGHEQLGITKRHIDGDRHILRCFERIRDTASLADALTRGDWDEVGRADFGSVDTGTAWRRASRHPGSTT